MAKTFVMGARLSLKDQFKSPISNITRSTMDFKKSVDATNRSVNTFRVNTGRLSGATGKFSNEGNKAAVVSRTWLNANGKLTSSLSLVTRGIQGAVAGFGLWKAKNFFIDSNASMEQYKNTLTTVLKSETKAVETLSWAEKFAAKTPFEIPQIVEATTKLSAYGINAQKTMGIIGDMASVMGKDLMQAVEAVADAQNGQMERMLEFSITKKMIEDQAKAMKVTVMNNKGQITDQKAFNAVMFKLMEERFKGGMERQSKSFAGMVSNAKDFMGKIGRTLGEPIFEAAKNGLGKLLERFDQLEKNGTIQRWAAKVQQLVNNVGKAINTYVIPAIKWLIDNGQTLAKVFSVMGPIVFGLIAAYMAYQKTVAIVTAITKAWAAVQAILNGTMMLNPIGLVVAAIVALIAIGFVMVKNWSAISKWFVGIWDTVKGALIKGAQAVGSFFVRIWNAIKGPAFAVFNAIKAVIMTVFDTAKNIVIGFVSVVASVIGGIVGVFKSVFNTVWNIISTVVGWIKGAFEGVGKAISTVFNGIIAVVKAPVNFLIGAINKLIKGINSLKVDIPDWVPLVGGKKFGFSIPEIPYLAKGTKNWEGGPAFMNERGGELAILPGGSQVIPADKTDKILDKPSAGTVTIHNHFNIQQQPGEDSQSFAEHVITVMYEKMSGAAEIANSGEMEALLGT
jgi:phage-related protein